MHEEVSIQDLRGYLLRDSKRFYLVTYSTNQTRDQPMSPLHHRRVSKSIKRKNTEFEIHDFNHLFSNFLFPNNKSVKILFLFKNPRPFNGIMDWVTYKGTKKFVGNSWQNSNCDNWASSNGCSDIGWGSSDAWSIHRRLTILAMRFLRFVQSDVKDIKDLRHKILSPSDKIRLFWHVVIQCKFSIKQEF